MNGTGSPGYSRVLAVGLIAACALLALGCSAPTNSAVKPAPQATEATTPPLPSHRAEDYVAEYYKAVQDEAWAKAFAMQPADSQKGGDIEGFKATMLEYRMVSFRIEPASEDASQASVAAVLDLGKNGNWRVTWSLARQGADWVPLRRTTKLVR